MEEFPYYTVTWFFYLIATAMFLLLCAWKSRSWSDWVRIPVLTFFAAMALTPGITVSGETWWSPAAIIMIFELDKNGLVGFWKGALSIIACWIVFMLISFIARWQLNKNKKKKTITESTVADDIPGQPDLIEPD